MASNFDFLLEKPEFDFFASACTDAENVLSTSPSAAAFGCRRALELAVKWVYAAENWPQPYSDNLQSLIHGQQFQREIDQRLWYKFKYIIRLGNNAAHSNKLVEEDEVILSLSHLFEFIEWIDYSFGKNYEVRKFDEKLIPKNADLEVEERFQSEINKMEKEISARESQLIEKDGIIEALKARLAAQNPTIAAEKIQHQQERTFTVSDPSEFKTRKKYIDVDLKMIGWTFGDNVLEEVEVTGMDGNAGQLGYADYVLYSKDGKALAVIEAKRTSKDPNIGKHQAKLYADCIEAETGRRPFIFLTNGFETFFWDSDAPPRYVSGIFGQNDLEKLMTRREQEKNLLTIEIDENITDRYYQKAAINTVCDDIMNKKRRHLLVMATGAGKTRTAASLVDVLSRGGHITNVLFLADRNALVSQAKDAFKSHLPTMSLCNLVTNKEDKKARIVFSTYPTILNAIDTEKSDDGTRFFTPAHFDLIIIDEAHRSIFKKYRAIFDYFDSHLVGLTATPKNEVARNTYDFFEKEPNVPTYAYDYETAVDIDHVLVPYKNYEMGTKFLEEGISYDKLSEEDKERYEEDFSEDGIMPESISPSEMNNIVFNQDTTDKVLQSLMGNGIKTGGGMELGKTIIFAQNKQHAQYIVERFDKLYPQYKGTFAQKITYEDSYAQSLINDFKVKDKMPQIAVSVDMLDTGIDVPEVVNLVFFKRVYSRTKFWQMIGRGTRLCEGLECFDQKSGGYTDKKYFYIFDVMGNFEFFNENKDIPESNEVKSLTELIFSKRVELIFTLQNDNFSDEDHQKMRAELVEIVLAQVRSLNPELFTVRQQLKYVEKFKEETSFICLSEIDKSDLTGKISSLVYSDDPDEYAVAFDNLVYGMMLSQIDRPSQFKTQKKKVAGICHSLLQKTTIPQVREKLDFIRYVESDDYWRNISLLKLEQLRSELRGLLKYIIEEGKKSIVFTNLTDELTLQEGKQVDISIDLENYHLKVTRYIEEHKDKEVIFKIRNNIQLTDSDYTELENILTNELGTKEDYQKEFGEIPFGLLVRQIVKLDEKAAKEAFSVFINKHPLTQDQMHFIKQLIQYLSQNGYVEISKLRGAPFDKPRSFTQLFDTEEQRELISLILQFKSNAVKLE